MSTFTPIDNYDILHLEINLKDLIKIKGKVLKYAIINKSFSGNSLSDINQ